MQCQTPDFKVSRGTEPDYSFVVHANAEVQARFSSEAAAQNWVAFMLGTRMAKPASSRINH
jgi:hypothetical protein